VLLINCLSLGAENEFFSLEGSIRPKKNSAPQRGRQGEGPGAPMLRIMNERFQRGWCPTFLASARSISALSFFSEYIFCAFCVVTGMLGPYTSPESN